MTIPKRQQDALNGLLALSLGTPTGSKWSTSAIAEAGQFLTVSETVSPLRGLVKKGFVVEDVKLHHSFRSKRIKRFWILTTTGRTFAMQKANDVIEENKW